MELNAWLYAMNRAETEPLKNAGLAGYITQLDQSSKAPSMIAEIVAAVKWEAKNPNRHEIGWAKTKRNIRRYGDAELGSHVNTSPPIQEHLCYNMVNLSRRGTVTVPPGAAAATL